MPTVYNDAVDDPLVYDGCINFSGGMESQSDPTLIAPTQCNDLKNVIHSRVGSILTRKGTSNIGGVISAGKVQGLSELYVAGGFQTLLAAVNGSMYKAAASTWSVATGYSPADATRNIEIVQGVNLAYICDNSQNVFSWDGTTFTNLGTSSPNPPIAKLLAWHTSRLFAVPANSDTVYASAVLNAVAGGWDWTNRSFRVGGGEGEYITSIHGWNDFSLLVFKYNSFYVVNADPSIPVANWTIKPVSHRTGCVAHRTGKMVGNDFLFLSRQGVRSAQRTFAELATQVSLPISFDIQPIIDRISWSAVSTACAEAIDNKYILAVPLDGATTPNYVLVYDTNIQKWSGYWSGWSPTVFLLSKINDQSRLLWGNTSGYVYKWLYDSADAVATYQDDGASIATSIKTRAINFQEIRSPKNGWDVELEFLPDSTATASLQAVLDQSDTYTVNASFATYGVSNQLPVNLPFNLATTSTYRRAFTLADLPTFREIQFLLTSAAGKISLKSIAASAFMNTVKYEE